MATYCTRASSVFVVFVSLCAVAQPNDPIQIFRQVRERLLADLTRMPRYTCVQTIERKYYAAPSHDHDGQCSAILAARESRKRDLHLEGWDRLRLEVAVLGNTSAFSWVGSAEFDDADLKTFAGRGPLGTGDFAGFLDAILVSSNVAFRQEHLAGGRRTLEYTYDIPIERSHYQIATNQGWKTVAFHGVFVLDVEAADIVSLSVLTAESPKGSPGCQAISEIDYGRTNIHDSMILIPRETRLRTIYENASETLNVTNYSACREYASTSRMLMQDPAESVATAAASLPSAPAATVPAGLQFHGRMTTHIDSDTAAAGDPIDVILRSRIEKGKNVVAPVGAHLHGRLISVEQRFDPISSFILGVQLRSVEVGGKDLPLAAISSPVVVSSQYMRRMFGRLVVPLQDPANGVALFLFPSEHLHLQDFDAQWTTVTPRTREKKPPEETKPKPEAPPVSTPSSQP